MNGNILVLFTYSQSQRIRLRLHVTGKSVKLKMFSRISPVLWSVQGLGKCWNKTFRRLYFNEKFTDDCKNKILKVINEFDEAGDLWQFSITPSNSMKLLKQRSKIGSYETLEEPLSAMGPRVLAKFYKSILSDGKPERVSSSVMNPSLTPEIISQSSKILSISTIANTVSWCLIHRKRSAEGSVILNMEELCLEVIDVKPRTHFLFVLSLVQELVMTLPECDLYVFEEATKMQPTPQQVAYALQKTQFQSYLMGLLSSRNNDSKLVSIKILAIARMFKLQVGNEKVSGQAVVEDMINMKNKFEMSEVFRMKFLNAEPTEREHLANAVLLNVAYWRLTNQF
ncbi:unnamed protein product [Allacma fusca]|uniref:Uncharacterized protein n=1 Tax=Allacma fusca TaxID=39272 RepID=A0A8J2NS08_9HEXA|nr:unnamed protein product [Allacma fusca]